MKQSDLRPCALCGNAVCKDGGIVFYRLTVEHFVLNAPAVERQAGLEMMLGGHAALAHIMGPNDDMAKPLGKPKTLLICVACSMKYIAEALEYEDPADQDGED